MYLLESYKGTEKIMGVILSAAYIVAKGSDILQRVKFLKRSFIKFLQKTVSCFSLICLACQLALNIFSLLVPRQRRNRFKRLVGLVRSATTTIKMQ